MIKIGILGAGTTAAGELIRILINHPDIELKTAASDSEAGRHISDIHRGLTGDTDLQASSTLLPEGHDAVFLCGEPWMAMQWMQLNADKPEMSDLRIIDLTGAFRDGSHNMVYGFPEYNRKADGHQFLRPQPLLWRPHCSRLPKTFCLTVLSMQP